MTGWVLFLDYLIVVALAGLFAPHYVGTAIGWDGLTRGPWDALVGVLVILGLAASRLVRRTQMYRVAVVVAGVALATHVLLIVLGGVFVLAREGFRASARRRAGTSSRSRCRSRCSPTPGSRRSRTTPPRRASRARRCRAACSPGSARSWSSRPLLAVIGLSAYPVEDGATGARRGVAARAARRDRRRARRRAAGWIVDVLRVVVGLTGAIVLVAAATTSISGAGRLAYSLARYEMLPRAFARLNRRTLISPVAIVAERAGLACVLLLLAQAADRPSVFLASVYSFGVLFAFTAAQVAVIRLRATEPGLERPFRAPLDVTIRGVAVPLPALVGAPLTFAVWIAALATHEGALVAGPVWVVLGLAVYALTRSLAARAAARPGHARARPTSSRSPRAPTTRSSCR